MLHDKYVMDFGYPDIFECHMENGKRICSEYIGLGDFFTYTPKLEQEIVTQIKHGCTSKDKGIVQAWVVRYDNPINATYKREEEIEQKINVFWRAIAAPHMDIVQNLSYNVHQHPDTIPEIILHCFERGVLNTKRAYDITVNYDVRLKPIDDEAPHGQMIEIFLDLYGNSSNHSFITPPPATFNATTTISGVLSNTDGIEVDQWYYTWCDTDEDETTLFNITHFY